MFRNYLKIALRTILRSKAYSFINIVGLSIGIACCLLLALYIQDEFSYDRHHRRLSDLYRVDTEFNFQGNSDKQGSISPPIAMTLRDEVPEIESATRALNPPGVGQNLIKYGDNVFYQDGGIIADSTFFDVLTYDLIAGNPAKALTDPNTVVISQTLARKIFGNEPALDKSILISQGIAPEHYKITGVFRDDRKSFLQISFVTSMMSKGWGEYVRTDPDASNEWAGQNFVPSYVKLIPGASQKDVERKINEVLVRHGAKNMEVLGIHKKLFLEPVKDIYLNSPTDKSPRITYLYVLGSIALFILLIACINFMNLSTAKASKRATEIGVRKVMGAFRGSLVSQILGEALVVVVISILISVALVQFFLPLFNQLSGKAISFNRDNIGYFGAALVILTLVTGLVAGSYPAFYISSFQPAQVLKSRFSTGSTTGRLRQALVIFQFMIAISLVCGMIVISRQLTFMQQQDLGFDARAKILIPLRTPEAREQYEVLKKELLANSAITGVAGCTYVPSTPIFSDMMYYTSGGDMDHTVDTKRNSVDAGYMELLGIKLVSGRPFTGDRKLESHGKVILNRIAAKKFGMDANKIIGQPLYFDWHGKKSTFEVVGVMDDYNQTSLKEEIVPTLFEIPEESKEYRYLVAGITASRFEETTATIEKLWKKQIQDTPFEYTFLDDAIQKQYDDDRKTSAIITCFTTIAIAICSLGLYGLSSFMAERRFKEIGVRKVMGASVRQIVTMMSGEFVKLVLVSFVISVPLAWYAMNRWLQGFAYKVPIDFSIFVYAGATAMVIALLTISYESIRAASANPVNSLRTE